MQIAVFNEVLIARKSATALGAHEPLASGVVSVHMAFQVEFGVVHLVTVWGHATVQQYQVFRHIISQYSPVCL